MRRTNRNRWIGGGLAVAALLMATGCGGEDGETASAPSETAAAAAPAPAEGRGDVLIEERDAATETVAAEPAATEAPAEEAALDEDVEVVTDYEAPAASEAPVLDEPRQDPALKAGSVDDNNFWTEYLDYRNESQNYGRPYEIAGRRVITVRDESGRPILGADVELIDEQGGVLDTARTVADGRALIFVPVAADEQSVESYSLKVRTEDTAVEVALADAVNQVVDLSVGGQGQQDGSAVVALDVLFLIDSTGSMDDEIDQLRANMIEVAESINQLPGQPDVRFAMTTYRDRHDQYITRSVDFTTDVQSFTNELERLVADGGGDKPEDLEAGLSEALRLTSWRSGERIGLVILVADAAPHIDYQDSVEYTTSIEEARRAGIKILPIASSGLTPEGEFIFRQLAQTTLGRFVFLTYGADGSGSGTSTDMGVDQYSVLPLDQLVVKLISDEIAAQAG